MKLYVAGPMTGYPQFNYPAFMEAARDLRSRHFEVMTPAEMDDPEIQAASMDSLDGNLDTITTHGQSWGDFLARDVKLLADDGIEAVVVLPGWERSKGARLETYVGMLCGLVIVEYPTLVPVAWQRLVAAWAGPPPEGSGVRVCPRLQGRHQCRLLRRVLEAD